MPHRVLPLAPLAVALAGPALAPRRPARATGERLAIYTKNAENANYKAFRLGADRAAAALGATTVHRVPARPDDPVEQTQMLEAELQNRPSAIVFAPADDAAMTGPIKKINDAAIPVVNFVNRMPGRFVTFVGADDYQMGVSAARYLFRALRGTGHVVIIEGAAGAPTSRDRVRGFRQVIAETPGVTLLGSTPGNYLRHGGLDAMARLLAAHPRIDGVLSANDSMSLGALDALAGAGRTTLIMSMNATIEAAEAIGAGRLLASMDYDGFKMGAIAAEAALRHLRGMPVPAEIMMPALVVDRTNYQAWVTPIEQRTCPKWEEIVR